MKNSKKYKQKFQEGVGYEPDSNEHAVPVSSVGFDEQEVELGLLGVTRQEFDEADTPEKKRRLFLAKGINPLAIAEFLNELPSYEHSPASEPTTVLDSATSANTTTRTISSDNESRWTVPEAMAHAQKRIANYLAGTAQELGWGALALGELFERKNQQLTAEQMEQLKNLSLPDRLARLAPPGVSVAEVIAGSIRSNPRSLLDPNAGHLVQALVDLLEAAHFGYCANRFPGLLPTNNRKRAASTARKALGLLARGSRGNPPNYPPELLASEVGLIRSALAPIKEAWAHSGSLTEIRKIFGDEVEGFKDKKLRSLLSDPLLASAAQLAEDATGVSSESFQTAWDKSPGIQKIFNAAIAQ